MSSLSKKLKITFALSAGFITAIPALAATLTPPSASSITQAQSLYKRLSDVMYFNYSGFFNGPSLTSPRFAALDTDTGEMTDLGGLDNTLSMGSWLKSNRAVTYGANLRFIDTFGGGGLTLKDPWASVRNSKIWSRNGFNLSSDLRLYAPLASYETTRTSLRTTQVLSYSVNSRFTLGVAGVARTYWLKDQTKGTVNQLSLSSFADYSINDKFDITASSDLTAYDFKNNGMVVDHPMTLSIGVGYNASSRVSINPQVTFVPSTIKASEFQDKAALTANISAKLL